MGIFIRFIAIIGSNNAPLYLKSFDPSSNPTGDSSQHAIEQDQQAPGDNLETDTKNDIKKTTDNPPSTKETELRYHFLAHMSLDYVLTQLTASETAKEYALLLVHDGIAVYGALSNTGIKFIVGTDANDNLRFDIRPTFKSIQRAYINYTCNPFHDVLEEQPITSPRFDLAITNVAKTWNTSTIPV